MICSLCPRACRAERTETAGAGVCGMGTLPVIARAAPHRFEEPCIAGTAGSGAVFFSGCALGCVYCQNAQISRGGQGERVTPRALAGIFARLEARGVHNINLVTASHFLPAVIEALRLYRPRVVVWNSGGYESLSALRALEGLVDVYLPDLKHVSPRLGAVCAHAPGYFDAAAPALQEMCRQTGAPRYDAAGLLTRGTLVRHLVLPGCTGDSMRALTWIADCLPAGTPVSLMRQYTPVPGVPRGLDRRVTAREYDRVLAHARALGLTGYAQGAGSADMQFRPAFDGTGTETGTGTGTGTGTLGACSP